MSVCTGPTPAPATVALTESVMDVEENEEAVHLSLKHIKKEQWLLLQSLDHAKKKLLKKNRVRLTYCVLFSGVSKIVHVCYSIFTMLTPSKIQRSVSCYYMVIVQEKRKRSFETITLLCDNVHVIRYFLFQLHLSGPTHWSDKQTSAHLVCRFLLHPLQTSIPPRTPAKR